MCIVIIEFHWWEAVGVMALVSSWCLVTCLWRYPAHPISIQAYQCPQSVPQRLLWWAYFTLYLGHLPNDFCVTSPTKLLHFPNNLSHFPNNLCHFPNTFSHFPNNFVSLCPPPKNLFFFLNFTCFSYLNIPASFWQKLNRFWGFKHACLVCST